MQSGNAWSPTVEIAQRFWAGLSKVVGAILVFLIGWIIVKFLKVLIIKFFRVIKIDKFGEDSGLKKLLEKGNISRDISELIGIAVYWLLMLVVIFIAVNFAGITIPETVINSLFAFVPKFILSLLIFIFSVFLGNFFGGIIRTSAGNMGIENASLLGKITHISIIAFGIVIALQEIGIAPDFVGNVFIIILSAFCFGAALSFALGSKDIIKEYLENRIKKDKDKKE